MLYCPRKEIAMTDTKERIRGRLSAGKLFFCVGASLSFFLIIGKSSVAIEYMSRGLSLCATTVIPSLFPFMVISEILVRCGIGGLVGKLFSRPMKALFGLSGSGSSAFFLGTLCGFPVGARTAVGLYDRGQIDKRELTHLLIFSNNPSSAFIISAVGVSLFSDKSFGIMLYVCVILSALTVGICASFFFRKEKDAFAAFPANERPGISVLTSSIVSSASGMLTVCAYVVFFSAIVGCLGSVISSIGLPDTVHALIFGFFELTSGVNEAAALENRSLAPLLCAFFAGWSGLSVHFQIMTICSDRGISFKSYFISKFCQGLLCAAYLFIAMKIFHHTLTAGTEKAFSLLGNGLSDIVFRCISWAFFASCCLFLAISRAVRRFWGAK